MGIDIGRKEQCKVILDLMELRDRSHLLWDQVSAIETFGLRIPRYFYSTTEAAGAIAALELLKGINRKFSKILRHLGPEDNCSDRQGLRICEDCGAIFGPGDCRAEHV